jgi:hypothetical protein
MLLGDAVNLLQGLSPGIRLGWLTLESQPLFKTQQVWRCIAGYPIARLHQNALKKGAGGAFAVGAPHHHHRTGQTDALGTRKKAQAGSHRIDAVQAQRNRRTPTRKKPVKPICQR